MLKVGSNCTTRDGEPLRNGAVGLATKQRVLDFMPPIVIANAAFPRHESAPPSCLLLRTFARVCRAGVGVEQFNRPMGGEFSYRFCSVVIESVQIYSPRRCGELVVSDVDHSNDGKCATSLAGSAFSTFYSACRPLRMCRAILYL